MEIVIQVVDQIWQFLVRIPFWLLLSAPLIIALYFYVRRIRETSWSNLVKLLSVVPLSAALLAPMPVSMFIVLVPNGYLLFSGVEYYSKIWVWCAVSLTVSLVVCYFAGRKCLKFT